MSKYRIAIFASGSGTNAERFFQFFQTHRSIEICCLLSNDTKAYALQRAQNHGVPTFVFNRADFYNKLTVQDFLAAKKIDTIVLAGFMWLVPDYLIKAYPSKIINIHPALLPKYGGKGMYGDKVHQSVIENGELESGITIHYVNHAYDEGQVIFQSKCEVKKTDNSDTLAKRIHELEYKFYPPVVESVLLNKKLPSL